ncbi:MAG: TetR/AcrR family transcriptional regulator [Acidobacteriota bacterium]
MLVSAKSEKTLRSHRTRLSSQQRRSQILQTAIKLFAERGFRGTTTRELANAAGVTEPVLYQHFKTKRDLYGAIIERKSQEGQEKFESRLAPYLARGDDVGYFRTLAELILEHFAEDPAFARLFLFSALERHELARLFYERHIQCFQQLISGYIRDRAKSKFLRRVDAQTAGCAFLGMVTRYGNMSVLFNEPLGRKRIKKISAIVVDIFMNGIAPGRKGRQ